MAIKINSKKYDLSAFKIPLNEKMKSKIKSKHMGIQTSKVINVKKETPKKVSKKTSVKINKKTMW